MSDHNYGYRMCPECGVAVQRTTLATHTCDPNRRADYLAEQAAPGLDRLETDLATWLTTPVGAFQQFLAERQVHHTPGGTE